MNTPQEAAQYLIEKLRLLESYRVENRDVYDEAVAFLAEVIWSEAKEAE